MSIKASQVLGAILGFVESAIWVVAISRVIQDLNDPLLILVMHLGLLQELLWDLTLNHQ